MQVLATFTATLPATFAQRGTTMPATFATFPATLAERHARRSIHRRPPGAAPPEQAAPPTKQQGNKGGGKRTAQAASLGAEDRATPQGHKQRPQGEQDGGGIGIAASIKTPCRRVKMANRAYSRKAPGIHREQKETPHSVSHAGRCYFWSFARSSNSRMGCSRIYSKIIVGTSLHLDCTTSAGAGQ